MSAQSLGSGEYFGKHELSRAVSGFGLFQLIDIRDGGEALPLVDDNETLRSAVASFRAGRGQDPALVAYYGPVCSSIESAYVEGRWDDFRAGVRQLLTRAIDE